MVTEGEGDQATKKHTAFVEYGVQQFCFFCPNKEVYFCTAKICLILMLQFEYTSAKIVEMFPSYIRTSTGTRLVSGI